MMRMKAFDCAYYCNAANRLLNKWLATTQAKAMIAFQALHVQAAAPTKRIHSLEPFYQLQILTKNLRLRKKLHGRMKFINIRRF